MRQLACIATLAAAAILSSCSDDPMRQSSSPTTEVASVSLEYYGSSVDVITGRSANDLYVAGSIVAHYDGQIWDLIEFPRYLDFVRSLWIGSDDALNLLDYGDIHRYDGRAWSSMATPLGFDDYCVTDNGGLYVSDWDRRVWSFDESVWSEMDSLPEIENGYYNGLAGDHDNLYAFGSDGSIRRHDGAAWDIVKGAGGIGFGTAWKDPAGPLYLTTWSDTLVAFDGSNMTPVDAGQLRIEEVFGNVPGEFFATARDYYTGDRSLLKRDASGWATLASDDRTLRYVAWGAPTGESFVGTASGVLRIDDDRRETILGVDTESPEMDGEFYDMWGTPSDGIVAIGARALHYIEGHWTSLGKEELTIVPAVSLCGTNRRDIWAVGQRMILHYDGDAWTWVHGGNQQFLSGVWCDNRNAIAVGNQGTILRYRGDDWETMDSGTMNDLRTVWGWRDGAFAGGEGGVILRFDGDQWSIEESPIPWTIHDMFGLSPQDIWAVGASSIEICHFDGHDWKPVDVLPLQGDCVSVWARSSQDVFVANNRGVVLHFDGREWSRFPRYMARNECLWGDSNNLLVGGSAIIRFRL